MRLTRFERVTYPLKGECSTCWATSAYQLFIFPWLTVQSPCVFILARTFFIVNCFFLFFYKFLKIVLKPSILEGLFLYFILSWYIFWHIQTLNLLVLRYYLSSFRWFQGLVLFCPPKYCKCHCYLGLIFFLSFEVL